MPNATTWRVPRPGPPICQPSRSETSLTSVIAIQAGHSTLIIEGNCVMVTKTSDAAPVASARISMGRNKRRPVSGAKCLTIKPRLSGSVIVETRRTRLFHKSRCTAVAESTKCSAACVASGVRKAAASGNKPVRIAAKARSERARRAKTGTTGAKGEVASNTIATAISRFTPKPFAAATASAGTIMKLASRMATKRERLSVSLTSASVSRKPTAPSNPTRAAQVRI